MCGSASDLTFEPSAAECHNRLSYTFDKSISQLWMLAVLPRVVSGVPQLESANQ